MAESVYAARAQVGERYVTKSGFPVVVVAVGRISWGKPAIMVEVEGDGNEVALTHDQLLWPRGSRQLSKEAIIMAKTKAAKKEKTGTRQGETVVEKVGDDKFTLTKIVDGKEHRVTINGGFSYKDKKYPTLQHIVAVILDVDYQYEGFGFFGLRNPANKAALTQARKVLKAEKAERVETAEKAREAAKDKKKTEGGN